MKKLILIRHAKSSWEAPLRDFDRPLTKNGIQDAHLVSSNIINDIPKTFLLWSSASKRAAETALIFAQNISFPINSIVFKEDLYTFDEKKLEQIIKTCPNNYDNLILFGHNEAITNFVNKFGNVFIDNVSTSGFVSINFDTDNWNSIKNGTTIKAIFPRDLK
jgi:phosphohistidine phosphatase